MAIPSYLPQKANIKLILRLDETSGTTAYDDSGLSHNGTASRTNIFSGAEGRISKCATFASASSDNISITNHADLRPTPDFSISAWIKTSTTDVAQTIFCSRHYDRTRTRQYGIQLSIRATNQPAIFSSKGTGNTENTDYKFSVHPNTCTDGKFHHVCGVYNSTTDLLIIYLDNVKSSVSWTYNPVYDATNNAVQVGMRPTADYFNGNIDEVILWNVALSSAEIAQVYAGPPKGGFSGVSNPWIFFNDAFENNKKLWQGKKLLLPKDLGFEY